MKWPKDRQEKKLLRRVMPFSYRIPSQIYISNGRLSYNPTHIGSPVIQSAEIAHSSIPFDGRFSSSNRI